MAYDRRAVRRGLQRQRPRLARHVVHGARCGDLAARALDVDLPAARGTRCASAGRSIGRSLGLGRALRLRRRQAPRTARDGPVFEATLRTRSGDVGARARSAALEARRRRAVGRRARSRGRAGARARSRAPRARAGAAVGAGRSRRLRGRRRARSLPRRIPGRRGRAARGGRLNRYERRLRTAARLRPAAVSSARRTSCRAWSTSKSRQRDGERHGEANDFALRASTRRPATASRRSSFVSTSLLCSTT